jgi:hypothetical protein
MSLTSFQHYLLKTYDDTNENDWYAEKTWGQFVDIEAQIISQIRDTVLSLNKGTTNNDKKVTTTAAVLPKLKSIPRIKSTKTLDLERNAITYTKENMNVDEINEEVNTKYPYISVTGIMFCIFIYINTHL